jgi:hypothetical protein
LKQGMRYRIQYCSSDRSTILEQQIRQGRSFFPLSVSYQKSHCGTRYSDPDTAAAIRHVNMWPVHLPVCGSRCLSSDHHCCSCSCLRGWLVYLVQHGLTILRGELGCRLCYNASTMWNQGTLKNQRLVLIIRAGVTLSPTVVSRRRQRIRVRVLQEQNAFHWIH